MARILAIDDEEGILSIVRRTLEKDGHTVTVHTSVMNVPMEYVNQYDLIILDIMMPDMDGIEFCKRIRAQVDCPILFLTAKTEESSIMYGLGAGGDDYITKPFGIGELRARIQAHLRREHREKTNAILVSGIRFDLAGKQVDIEGKIIALTKSEYEISEYLAMNHGRVFSKEQIFEAVFGYERDSDLSAITEHVKNIRAKLSKYGLEPIETVWGIGYKWR